MTFQKSLAAAVVAAAVCPLWAAPVAGAAGLVRVEGPYATANLVVAEGCDISSLSLGVSRRPADEASGRPTTIDVLFVGLERQDVCAGTTLFSGGAAQTLGEEALEISQRRASLRTELELVDGLGTGQTARLALDLQWVAEDDPLGRFRDRYRGVGGGRISYFGMEFGIASDARLAGTASTGEIDFMSGEAGDVRIGRFGYGFLSLPDRVAAAADAANLMVPAAMPESDRAPSRSGADLAWASAYWQSSDASGCIQTFGLLGPSRLTERRSGPTRESANVALAVTVYDHCAGRPLSWIETEYPLAALPADSFSLEPNMSGATLSAAFAAFDALSGAPVTLRADVRWTRTSSIVHSSSAGQGTWLGAWYSYLVTAATAEATATGTISESIRGEIATIRPEYVFSGYISGARSTYMSRGAA